MKHYIVWGSYNSCGIDGPYTSKEQTEKIFMENLEDELDSRYIDKSKVKMDYGMSYVNGYTIWVSRNVEWSIHKDGECDNMIVCKLISR